MARYHEDGTAPPGPDWVWVFGSNMMGVHGAGAARIARLQYGAVDGMWSGPTGRAYAIPTKMAPHGPPRDLPGIHSNVMQFLEYARQRPELQFWVTAIGEDQHIAPMFEGAPRNCSLPLPWHNCDNHIAPAPDRLRWQCTVCGSISHE